MMLRLMQEFLFDGDIKLDVLINDYFNLPSFVIVR